MKQDISVLLSILLSVRVENLGLASLVFSKFWHDARSPYKVVRDKAKFSRKNFFSTKIEKMDEKWAKNRVFF